MGILSNFFTILFSPGWEIHSRRVRCYRCWRFEAVQVSLAATDRGFFIDRAALPKKNARRLSNGGHSGSVERFLGELKRQQIYGHSADFWSQSQCVNDDDDDDGSDQERTTVVAVSNRCEGKFALSPPARNLLIQQLLLSSAF